jgi:hypothetical protein
MYEVGRCHPSRGNVSSNTVKLKTTLRSERLPTGAAMAKVIMFGIQNLGEDFG